MSMLVTMKLQKEFSWQNEAFEFYADQNLYHVQTLLDKCGSEKQSRKKKEARWGRRGLGNRPRNYINEFHKGEKGKRSKQK